jgi:hypothetical protein
MLIVNDFVLIHKKDHVKTGPPVSSTNKTDCHDITEIFLNVALNTIDG